MVKRANARTKESVPAVVHFDGAARVQYLTAAGNPRFHRPLQEFKKCSRFSVLINTSFNIQEPVVCTPDQAKRTFKNCSMNYLAIEDYLVQRAEAGSVG